MNFYFVTALLLPILCLHESGAALVPGEGSHVAEPVNPVAKRTTEHLRTRRDATSDSEDTAEFEALYKAIVKAMKQAGQNAKTEDVSSEAQSTRASDTLPRFVPRDDSTGMDPNDIAALQRFLGPLIYGLSTLANIISDAIKASSCAAGYPRRKEVADKLGERTLLEVESTVEPVEERCYRKRRVRYPFSSCSKRGTVDFECSAVRVKHCSDSVTLSFLRRH